MEDSLISTDEMEIALKPAENEEFIECELCGGKIAREVLGWHWQNSCSYFINKCDSQ